MKCIRNYLNFIDAQQMLRCVGHCGERNKKDYWQRQHNEWYGAIVQIGAGDERHQNADIAVDQQQWAEGSTNAA